MSSEKFKFMYDEREICLLDSLPQIYHPISDYRAMANVSGGEVCELYSGVKYIIDNAFINTSSEKTLSKWEGYLKIVPSGTDTIDERRFRILAKLNDCPPYTDRYLVNKLTELCGANNFRITREYDQYKLTIEISLVSPANTETVMDIVKSIVPANIDLTVKLLRTRHQELRPLTHEYLSNYTHDEIKYRVCFEPRLIITKQPESVTAAVGTNAEFSVVAQGNDLTYQWQWRASDTDAWRNTSLPGNQTNTITAEATTARNGYQYRCTIYDASGNMMYSDVVTLTVVSILITRQPQSQAAVAGDTVTFSVEAIGVKSYRWQVLAASGNWDNIGWDGCDSATMTHEMNINNIQYQYRCRLESADGTVVYTDIIHFAPVLITKQPENAIGSIGDTVTFSLEASGNISMYRWQRSTDGGATWSAVYWGNSGFDTNTFTFTVSDEGRLNGLYRCMVYCADGDAYNVASDVVSITPA